MHPKFSIALPVYNGGIFLKPCIESILNQSYQDFQLLIFNSSNNNDGSTELIRSITDERIKIVQATEPLNIEQNWSRFIQQFNTEFATIIGQDDLYSPNFLEEMNALILRYPDASLWHSRFNTIDKEGKKIRSSLPLPLTESTDEYLESILLSKADSIGTGYVFRSQDYKNVGGIPTFPSLLFADLALWIQLSHISYKVNSQQTLFSFRIHDSTTSLSSANTYIDSLVAFIRFIISFGKSHPMYLNTIRINLEAYIAFCMEIIAFKIIRSKEASQNSQHRLTVQKSIHSLNKLAQQEHWPLASGRITFSPKTKVVAIMDSNLILLHIYQIFARLKTKFR